MMLNRFSVRFSLFCILLFLLALIIDTNMNTVRLPVEVSYENNESKPSSEYVIYVSDFHHLMFPLYVAVNKDKGYDISFYQDRLRSETDQAVYMTFSLLTNYSNYLPEGVKTDIPQSTELLNYTLSGGVLKLNLSHNFLYYNTATEIDMLKALTYTFTSLPGVSQIKLLCENREVAFLGFSQNTFGRADFNLNVVIDTTDVIHSEVFTVYYYSDLETAEYLVPITIYETPDYATKDERLAELLTDTFNLPIKSALTAGDLTAGKTSLEGKKLSQYYFTYYENGLIEQNQEMSLSQINHWSVSLR